MKHIKIYENYITDKIKNLRKFSKIVKFMDKYKIPFFISWDTPDYFFHKVYYDKDDNNKIKLDWEDYTQGETKTRDTEISQLPTDVIDQLVVVCGTNDRFNITAHLENDYGCENFIYIIKKHKEPIEFSGWMFSLFIEHDKEDEVNSYKFQNTLFTTHPEAFNVFMDEVIDSKKRHKEMVDEGRKPTWKPIRLNPRIKTKFKNLYDTWEAREEGKKYNL